MEIDAIVRLRNVGTESFKARYLTQKVEIPAQSEMLVPFPYIAYWMGNPDLVDIDHKRKFRTKDYERIRLLYGQGDPWNEVEWPAKAPKLEAYTTEGERLWTVLDDPTGEHVNPANATVDQQQLILDRMQAMEAELRTLRQAAEQQGAEKKAQAFPISQDAAPIQQPPGIPVPAPSTNPLLPDGQEAETVLDAPVRTAVPTINAEQPVATPGEPDDEVTEDTPTRMPVG